MARRPVGFGSRGSRRTDPRKRIEGGDIFQRRALKDATRAIEKGLQISDRTRGALGPNADKLIDSAADKLQSSGRNVGGSFNRSSLSERLARQQQGGAFGTSSVKQREFTVKTAIQQNRPSLLKPLTDRPLTDFTRRTFGPDTRKKRDRFRNDPLFRKSLLDREE